MKIKALICCTAISLLLSFSAPIFAANPKNQPVCPSASALQKSLFVFAAKNPTGGWLVFQPMSQYETSDKWLFALLAQGEDRIEAIKHAYQSIRTLQPPRGPVNVLGVWFCDYADGNGGGGQARIISS